MIQTIKNNFMMILGIAVLMFMSCIAVAPVTHADGAINIRGNTNCGSGNQKNNDITLGGNATQAATCKDAPPAEAGISGVIRTVINVLSAIVGAISVIMIIIGGFRYVTSAGDSNNVSGAKNTILYAIVGLIIVAFAQVIVQFVLQRTA